MERVLLCNDIFHDPAKSFGQDLGASTKSGRHKIGNHTPYLWKMILIDTAEQLQNVSELLILSNGPIFRNHYLFKFDLLGSEAFLFSFTGPLEIPINDICTNRYPLLTCTEQ